MKLFAIIFQAASVGLCVHVGQYGIAAYVFSLFLFGYLDMIVRDL
jgi:hypothetical protein